MTSCKIYLYPERREYVLVDCDDLAKLSQYKWYKSTAGYAITTYHKLGSSRVDSLRNVNVSMARVILKAPANLVVDHINGNRLDNRKANLRLVTYQENSLNSLASRDFSKTPGIFKTNEKTYLVNIGGICYGHWPNLDLAKQVYNRVVASLYPTRLCYPDIPVYDGQIKNLTYCSLASYTGKVVGVSFYRAKQARKKRWRFIHKGKTLGYFYTKEDAESYGREFYESNKKSSC